jgi:hypothetical protein
VARPTHQAKHRRGPGLADQAGLGAAIGIGINCRVLNRVPPSGGGARNLRRRRGMTESAEPREQRIRRLARERQRRSPARKRKGEVCSRVMNDVDLCAFLANAGRDRSDAP